MTTQALEIGGMSCGHCLRAVKDALSEMPGVTLDEVRIGKAVVTFDESTVQAESIAEAVRDAGYFVLAVK